jgi:hypothetical protein
MTRTLEELSQYLVGHWKFDGDFKDSSGNGNHGVPTDVEWKPTERGMKPYNTTYNGYVSCGTDSTLDVSGNIQFSISFWCYIANKNESQVFCAAGDALSTDGDRGFAISYANNGAIYFDVYDDSTRSIVAGNINKGLNHIVVTWDGNGSGRIYINGLLLYSNDSMVSFINTQFDFRIFSAKNNPPWNGPKWMDDVRFYKNVIFAPDEVLALYESTKQAYGVRPAERSFTHRLQPDVDANTVVAFDMSTKNSDGTLMDLSGEGYANLYGAVRDSGYFADAIRFDKDNENYGRIFALNGEITDKLHIELLTIKHSPAASVTGVFDGIYLPQYLPYGIGINSYNTFYCADGDDNGENIQGINYTLGVLRHTVIDFDGEKLRMYDDGVKTEKTSSINQIQLPGSNFYLSRRVNTNYCYFDNTLYFLTVSLTTESDSQIKSRFNSLATLPLYTFDASKYPTSSGWTANVPYSSMSISSGEFSFTDDGQLQCDSAGSFTLRNAHEFDGDEYIKLTINDTVYAGTGTITQGTTTASIEQGSTLITVDMVAGDTIDSIDIQFREPVE